MYKNLVSKSEFQLPIALQLATLNKSYYPVTAMTLTTVSADGIAGKTKISNPAESEENLLSQVNVVIWGICIRIQVLVKVRMG